MPVETEIAVRHDAMKYAILMYEDHPTTPTPGAYIQLAERIAHWILTGKQDV